VNEEMEKHAQQLALREYYLTRAPVESMAPNLRLGVKSFYLLLNEARREVRDRLIAAGDCAC
jgi:hypothetical protein